MGENFFCPNCDHVDNIIGECPECGGTLTKLDVNPEVNSEGFGYDDVELISPDAREPEEFTENEDFNEGGLQTTF